MRGTDETIRKLAENAAPATRALLLQRLDNVPPPPVTAPPPDPTGKEKKGIRFPKTPQKTNAEVLYEAQLRREFPGKVILFESLTFLLPGGTKYTPDFTVWDGAAMLLGVEVKGTFRLASAGRSHVALIEIAAAFPHLRWRYAKQNDNGTFTITEKQHGNDT